MQAPLITWLLPQACTTAEDDATEALSDKATFPVLFVAGTPLPGWIYEDGYMLVMCQAVKVSLCPPPRMFVPHPVPFSKFPKRTDNSTTAMVDLNKVKALPDRVGDVSPLCVLVKC